MDTHLTELPLLERIRELVLGCHRAKALVPCTGALSNDGEINTCSVSKQRKASSGHRRLTLAQTDRQRQWLTCESTFGRKKGGVS